jgi:hypothetical protein
VRFDTLQDSTPFKENILKDRKILYKNEISNE